MMSNVMSLFSLQCKLTWILNWRPVTIPHSTLSCTNIFCWIILSETHNYDIILDLDRGTTQRSSSSSGQALSSYNRRDDLNQSVRTSSGLDRSSSMGKTDTSRSQQYSSKSQMGSSQYSRDRQEGLGRQTGAGGSGNGRQKWSVNDNRGSVSPGKENMDQNGYR